MIETITVKYRKLNYRCRAQTLSSESLFLQDKLLTGARADVLLYQTELAATQLFRKTGQKTALSK
ncbi:MAG TPA: hypothetical protein DHU55_11725 [Blastocatellia bacterium]|jgi:hypothetical protein|nr:hypothetical protein [Blastocatellia bacterium]HAF23833.1 hypothetical protein [Blastocatellia bacterium]HCX30416.1 hypothetical protein [Blastocatellia bacterium]